MKTRYTAITIGPIYKTFNYAKKTRELWAGSYIFSYLMKNIIKEIKKVNGVEIIIPFTDDKLLTGKNETGLFPDRLVFQSDKTIDEIKKITDNVIEKVAGEMADDLIAKVKGYNKNDIQNYFKNYFQIYLTQKEFDDSTKKHEIVKSLFDSLDVLELQQKYIPEEPENYMRQFLTKASFKAGKNHSFLIQDARDINANENVKFQSLIEISATEIINKLSDENKTKFKKILKDSFDKNKSDDSGIIDFFKDLEKKNEIDFKTHHKYIAILQIDGDNFGKINKQLDDNDFVDFSRRLSAYSFAVKDIITGYGGLPVYIGGDDVLAFVPVRNGEENIFTLIDKIDRAVKDKFGCFATKEFTDDGKSFKISLSAGISVTYYKFPLQEALNISYDLLNEKAKKFDGKNAVAFKVLKHSGQTFETIFKKTDNCLYIRFKELINLNIDDGQFFSSVIQKSFENFDLLEMVADNKNRIHAYHKEFYNESFHGTKKDFIDQLETYIHELFQSQEYKNKKDDLYAALRMVKFLNRDDND